MRAVLMDLDPFLLPRINIPGNVRPLFYDQAGFPGFPGLPRENSPEQPGANHQIVIFPQA